MSETSSSSVSRPLSRAAFWRRQLGVRGLGLALFGAAGALVGLTAPLHAQVEPLSPSLRWVLGLVVHFQWLYLAVALLGTVLALVGRRWSVLLPLAVTVAGWSQHMPAAPAADAAAQRPALRVATANLYVDNPSLDGVIRWLDTDAAPDIVVLQEFSPAHQAQLEASAALQARYPHRHLQAASDPFGLAVLSRWPLSQPEVAPAVPGAEASTLEWRVQVQWDAQPVLLDAIHPMPPLNAASARVRDAQVLAAARHLAAQPLPALLVGDFNDTPWSGGMRGLSPLLFNASGLTPTWLNLFGGLAVLPIDHVLVTPGWQVVRHEAGPLVGSDHRPLLVELQWAGR